MRIDSAVCVLRRVCSLVYLGMTSFGGAASLRCPFQTTTNPLKTTERIEFIGGANLLSGSRLQLGAADAHIQNGLSPGWETRNRLCPPRSSHPETETLDTLLSPMTWQGGPSHRVPRINDDSRADSSFRMFVIP